MSRIKAQFFFEGGEKVIGTVYTEDEQNWLEVKSWGKMCYFE